MQSPQKLARRSSELADWCRRSLASGRDAFDTRAKIVRRLGAKAGPDGVDFGFWIPTPEPPPPLWLELLVPVDGIGPEDDQTIRFRRSLIKLDREGEFAWAAAENVPVGGRGGWGAFYWVRRGDPDGSVWHDFMAASLPFGCFAPAEVYDWERVQGRSASNEPDRDPPAGASPPRLPPPSNILEIHVPTATEAGHLAALTEVFRGIAAKLRRGRALETWEKVFHGYEAVELLPLEPVAEPRRPPFWRFLEGPRETPSEPSARLLRPKISNWGYDTLIAGFAAVNPGLLSQGRPHELADLAACLRDFPGGPIRIIFDVVLGHAHSQAEQLLDRRFFAGASPYGKSLDYSHPTVRAILLELLRRKLNWGADGVRVDASQDVRSPGTGPEGPQDDAFLDRISETVIESAGRRRYRPFMIFEDGRPWPRADWKLTATCLDVRRRQPHALQWSPWTFSSNLPLDPTFWISRKWRLDETVRHGRGWVTGCSNHDTLRHGAASPPGLFGQASPARFREAYDNPAALLLCHGFLPGVPMDFLQAAARAPWTFFRNCDDHPLKTVCGDLDSIGWLTDPAAYRQAEAFPRLKALGLPTFERLLEFARRLQSAARLADFKNAKTAEILRETEAIPLAPASFCRAWMGDMVERCNTQAHCRNLDPRRVQFHLGLRNFRLDHPWLRENLNANDLFEHAWRFEGAVVYRGRRTSPDNDIEIAMLVNLAGTTAVLSGEDLPSSTENWKTALAFPSLGEAQPKPGFRIEAGQGLLWTRSV